MKRYTISPRLHYSTFVIITIITIVNGVDKKRDWKKEWRLQNDDVSKNCVNLNNDVDSQVYDNILHIMKHFKYR